MADTQNVTEEQQQETETGVVDEASEQPVVEQRTDGEIGAETDADEEPLSLEEQLEQAQAQAAEYLDGWQRARAEFANARKRMEKARLEARRTAKVDVLRDLLPIVDDFDRALETAPQHVAEDSWFEGVELVYRKLTGMLEDASIERIESVGEPFDPNFHEAVLQEESQEHESGTIIRELQPGYRLGDRVIRPAMVTVAI